VRAAATKFRNKRKIGEKNKICIGSFAPVRAKWTKRQAAVGRLMLKVLSVLTLVEYIINI